MFLSTISCQLLYYTRILNWDLRYNGPLADGKSRQCMSVQASASTAFIKSSARRGEANRAIPVRSEQHLTPQSAADELDETPWNR